jgi:flagellar basal-body rod protein FlgB
MSSKLDGAFQFSQAAMNLHAYRQQLIASNIANADTPGYRAKDVDFASALKDARAAVDGKPQMPQLRQPAANLSGEKNVPLDAPVLYRSAVQRSADGNTVDIDVERAQFAENSVRYEAQLQFISGQIKTLLSAIQG